MTEFAAPSVQDVPYPKGGYPIPSPAPQEPSNPFQTETRFRDLQRMLDEEVRRRDAEFLQHVASQGALHELSLMQLQQATQDDNERAIAAMSIGMATTGEGWRVPRVRQQYADLIAGLEGVAGQQMPEQLQALRQQYESYGAIGGAMEQDTAALQQWYQQNVAQRRGPEAVGSNLAESIIAELTFEMIGKTGDRRERAINDVLQGVRNLVKERYQPGTFAETPPWMVQSEPQQEVGAGFVRAPRPAGGGSVGDLDQREYEHLLTRAVLQDVVAKMRMDPDLDPKTVAGIDEAFANEAARYGSMAVPIGIGSGIVGAGAQKAGALVKPALSKMLGSTITKVAGKGAYWGAQAGYLGSIGAGIPLDAYQRNRINETVAMRLGPEATTEELEAATTAAEFAERFKQGAAMATLAPLWAIAGPAAQLVGEKGAKWMTAPVGNASGAVERFLSKVFGGAAFGATFPAMAEAGTHVANIGGEALQGVAEPLGRAFKLGLFVDDDPIKPVLSMFRSAAAGDVDGLLTAMSEYGRRITPAMAGFASFNAATAMTGVSIERILDVNKRREFVRYVETQAVEAKKEIDNIIDEQADSIRAEGGDPELVRQQLHEGVDQQVEEVRQSVPSQTKTEQVRETVPDTDAKIAEDRGVREAREAAELSTDIDVVRAGKDVEKLESVQEPSPESIPEATLPTRKVEKPKRTVREVKIEEPATIAREKERVERDIEDLRDDQVAREEGGVARPEDDLLTAKRILLRDVEDVALDMLEKLHAAESDAARSVHRRRFLGQTDYARRLRDWIEGGGKGEAPARATKAELDVLEKKSVAKELAEGQRLDDESAERIVAETERAQQVESKRQDQLRSLAKRIGEETGAKQEKAKLQFRNWFAAEIKPGELVSDPFGHEWEMLGPGDVKGTWYARDEQGRVLRFDPLEWALGAPKRVGFPDKPMQPRKVELGEAWEKPTAVELPKDADVAGREVPAQEAQAPQGSEGARVAEESLREPEEAEPTHAEQVQEQVATKAAEQHSTEVTHHLRNQREQAGEDVTERQTVAFNADTYAGQRAQEGAMAFEPEVMLALREEASLPITAREFIWKAVDIGEIDLLGSEVGVRTASVGPRSLFRGPTVVAASKAELVELTSVPKSGEKPQVLFPSKAGDLTDVYDVKLTEKGRQLVEAARKATAATIKGTPLFEVPIQVSEKAKKVANRYDPADIVTSAPKSKKAQALHKILLKFAAPEETRYAINGVFYSETAAAATDGRVLFEVPIEKGPKVEQAKGKVIGPDGSEMDNRFPDYRQIRPADSSLENSGTYSVQSLLDAARSLAGPELGAQKDINLGFTVQMEDGSLVQLNRDYIVKLADGFRSLGYDTVEIRAGGAATPILLLGSDNGVTTGHPWALLMPISGDGEPWKLGAYAAREPGISGRNPIVLLNSVRSDKPAPKRPAVPRTPAVTTEKVPAPKKKKPLKQTLKGERLAPRPAGPFKPTDELAPYVQRVEDLLAHTFEAIPIDLRGKGTKQEHIEGSKGKFKGSESRKREEVRNHLLQAHDALRRKAEELNHTLLSVIAKRLKGMADVVTSNAARGPNVHRWSFHRSMAEAVYQAVMDNVDKGLRWSHPVVHEKPATLGKALEIIRNDYQDAVQLGTPEAWAAFQANAGTFLHGALGVIARYYKPGAKLVADVMKQHARMIQNPKESGRILLFSGQGGGASPIRKVVDGIVAFARSNLLDRMVAEQAEDPKAKFGFFQRQFNRVGMANPVGFAGWIARDGIKAIVDAAGAFESLNRQLLGTGGLLGDVEENSPRSKAMFKALEHFDSISKVGDDWLVSIAKESADGVAPPPEQYKISHADYEKLVELRRINEEFRSALVRFHPAMIRMRREVEFSNRVILDREAEYQEIKAKRDEAVEIRDSMPEWAEIKSLKKEAKSEFGGLDEAPAEFHRRIEENARAIHRALREEGHMLPEQYSGVLGGIRQNQNRMLARREGIAEQMAALRDSWGIENYVHHAIDPRADADIVDALFEGRGVDDFGGFEARKAAETKVEQALGAKRRVGTGITKTRKEVLKNQGVLSEDIIRSVYSYIRQFPVYVKRMEFLGAIDEFLYGRLEHVQEIQKTNEEGETTTVHEAMLPHTEVVYEGYRGKSYGSMLAVPDENGKIAYRRWKDLSADEQQRWKEYKARESEERFVARMLGQEVGAEARPADFEVVPLWIGDREQAPTVEALTDPFTVAKLQASAAGPGGPIRGPMLLAVPLRDARQNFRLWRDGWYGKAIEAADHMNGKAEWAAIEALSNYIQNQVIGTSVEMQTGRRVASVQQGIAKFAGRASQAGEATASMLASLMSMNTIGGPTNVRNAIQAGFGGMIFAYTAMGRWPSSRARRGMREFGRVEKEMKGLEQKIVKRVWQLLAGDRNLLAKPEIALKRTGVDLHAELDKVLGIDDPEQVSAAMKMGGKAAEQVAIREAVGYLLRSNVLGGNRGDQLLRNMTNAVGFKMKDARLGKIHRYGRRKAMNLWRAVNDGFWMPFNIAERYARAMPWMDVYLERRLGGATPEAARDAAFSAVHATQMVYSKASKPRAMNTIAGRLFGALTTWSVHAQGRAMGLGPKGYAILMGRLMAFALLGQQLGRGLQWMMEQVVDEEDKDSVPQLQGLSPDLARMTTSSSTDVNTGLTKLVSGRSEGELLTGYLGGALSGDLGPSGWLADGTIPNLPLPLIFTGPGPFYDTASDVVRGAIDAAYGGGKLLDRTVGETLRRMDPVVHANWFRRIVAAASAEYDPATGSLQYIQEGKVTKDFSDLAAMARGVGLDPDLNRFGLWAVQQAPFVRETRGWVQGVINSAAAEREEQMSRRRAQRVQEFARAFLTVSESAPGSPEELAAREAGEAPAQEAMELSEKLGRPLRRQDMVEAVRREQADRTLPGHLRAIQRAGAKVTQARMLTTVLRDDSLYVSMPDVQTVLRDVMRADTRAGLTGLPDDVRDELVAALQWRYRRDWKRDEALVGTGR